MPCVSGWRAGRGRVDLFGRADMHLLSERTENLCKDFRATGRDVNGGYAELMTVSEDYAYPYSGYASLMPRQHPFSAQGPSGTARCGLQG